MTSLVTFHFRARCGIPQRLNALPKDQEHPSVYNERRLILSNSYSFNQTI